MNCDNKISNRCGTKSLSQCVEYELTPPNISELTGNCNTIEDTTTDIYNILKRALDTRNLEDMCIDIPKNSKGNIELTKAIEVIIEALCDLKENQKVNQNVCGMSIVDCGIDTGGMIDPCNPDSEPKTLGALLNVMIRMINEGV